MKIEKNYLLYHFGLYLISACCGIHLVLRFSVMKCLFSVSMSLIMWILSLQWDFLIPGLQLLPGIFLTMKTTNVIKVAEQHSHYNHSIYVIYDLIEILHEIVVRFILCNIEEMQGFFCDGTRRGGGPAPLFFKK